METKPLNYVMHQVTDQKWTVAVLLLAESGFLLTVWNCDGWISVLSAFFLLSAVVWHVFVPVRFEINSSGIIRSVFGRKWFVSWKDIRAYQIRRNGLLLLPQKERFPLEPLNAFFLPVPKDLMTAVLYRFRLLAGE
ncbi:MAG: hypothetical protein LBH00_12340 [Planctomycetaceae bacterium]|jgi:hypothetical protein|nr:hypothetical protein [Planctomycetaceae bacterium]